MTEKVTDVPLWEDHPFALPKGVEIRKNDDFIVVRSAWHGIYVAVRLPAENKTIELAIGMLRRNIKLEEPKA